MAVSDPIPTTYHIGVYCRPFLQEFLRECAKMFDLCVFTASMKIYCDAVMARIDPGNLCGQRLYRDDCVQIGQLFVKDLGIFNRSLADVILMDNSALSFQNNPRNGLLCPEFFTDRTDCYLRSVLPFLRELSGCADVRDVLMQGV